MKEGEAGLQLEIGGRKGEGGTQNLVCGGAKRGRSAEGRLNDKKKGKLACLKRKGRKKRRRGVR